MSKVEELKVQCPCGAERRPEARTALCLLVPRALRFLPSALRYLEADPWHLTPFPTFCLLLTTFSLLPAAYCFYAARGLYVVREIKPQVFVWVPDDVIDQETDPEFSRAGTAGFIVTPDGVAVVDTTNSPFHARELLYEIRQRSDAPIKYVINTNSAGDHILGNEVFTDQQATLIATSAAQAEMRRYQQDLARRLEQEETGWRLQARMRGFHITLPNQTFDSGVTLSLGGQEIRLVANLGVSGAPEIDAAVHLPAAKVVFLGELYNRAYFPRIGSRNIRRWIAALHQVEGWNAESYVPGHGEPGGKKELAEFREYLEWLEKEVQTRIKEGKSLVEIKRELDPAEHYAWHAPELAAEDVEAAYNQLGGTPPAQANGHQP